MTKHLFFIITIVAVLSSCKSKSSISNSSNSIDSSFYQKAKEFLAAAQYNRGIDAIDRAIEANEVDHLEELYFLKGFILHAYGETTDAREAYQQVIDMEKAYSPYRDQAMDLLALNIEEEKWKKDKIASEQERKETFTDEEIEEMDADDLPFKAVEKLPRFTSCPDGSMIEVKQCTNDVIKKHLMRNYNSDIGNTFGVYQKVRTYISYKVDADGKLIDIQGRSQSRFLTLEAKRVIYTLPKMLPGKVDGKNVTVPFAIPVTYAPM